MTLIENLTDEFLFNSYETISVLNTETGEIMLDASESLTGEPEIDWDSEEAENLVVIPQITPGEAYDVRVRFAEAQKAGAGATLLEALNRRKPFRNFKIQLAQLNLEDDFYKFEYQYAKDRMAEWLDEWR